MRVWMFATDFVANNGKSLSQSCCKIDSRAVHEQVAETKAWNCCLFDASLQGVAAEPKRILMVDDDVALLRVVREGLVASLKWEVDTSPKPEYAFELALKKEYELLIFDFQMPMIDGAMLFS